MSTTTAPRPAAEQASRTHLSFTGVARSEWIKLWTLRSTVWTLILTVVLAVGVGVLVSFAFTSDQNGQSPASQGIDYSTIVSFAMSFSRLAVAVLGVLAITGEYSTGMIRSTLTAVPKRLPVLWAKALVLAVVCLLAGAVTAVLVYLATAPVLSGTSLEMDLSHGETVRVLAGIPLYLTGIALLAFAIGVLLRSSPASLATVLGLLLVVEGVLNALPWKFFTTISPYLPATAGSRIISTAGNTLTNNGSGGGTVLGPWEGYLVLLAWVVVLLAVGAVLLKRRDA